VATILCSPWREGQLGRCWAVEFHLSLSFCSQMIGLREVMTPQDGNKEIARLDGVAFLMVGGIPNSKADISICEIPVGNQADTLALCVYRRVPSGKSGCFLVKRKFNGVEQPSLGEESCGVE
jgi:hypothetical protein